MVATGGQPGRETAKARVAPGSSALAAVSSACVVRRCGKRSSSGEEVATSPSSRTEWVERGHRSECRARAVGTSPFERVSPPGGAERGWFGAQRRASRTSPQGAARRRAGVQRYMLLRTWSPSNGGVGSLPVATPATRAVGFSVIRRESRRVTAGVAKRRVPLGARTAAFGPSGATLRCRDGGSRASGSRGQRAARHPVASKAR